MSGAAPTSKTPRPRQVTLGAVLALTGCLLLVVSMLDSMAQVRSVDTRESVTDVLSTSPGSGLGITVETVLGLLRVLVLVTGGLGAAGVVLAGYALFRHRGARVGLTVVAGLLLLTGTFVSGLLPVAVAVGASMLWGRDARAWFAGRPVPEPAAPARRPDPTPPTRTETPVDPWSQPPPSSQPSSRPPTQPQSQPGPTTGWPASGPGAPPPATSPAPPTPPPTTPPPTTGPPAWPPAYAWPGPAGPSGPTGPVPPPARPVTVTLAAVLTWVFSGVTLLLLMLLVVTLLGDRDGLLSALQANPQVAANNYSSQELLAALWVIGAVGITWCLAAIALAVLAFRRVNLGRIGLVVSASVTALIGLVTVVGLVNAAAAIATVVLLFVGGANHWYAGDRAAVRPSGPHPPAGPQPPSGPPPPSGASGDAPRDRPPVW